LVGSALTGAKRHRQRLLGFWSKCNKAGAAAWYTGPETISTLKMPINLAKEYQNTVMGSKALSKALEGSCPGIATRRRLFGLLPDADKTTAAQLLAAYAQEKEAALQQSALSEKEKAEAKAAEVKAAEQQAKEAEDRANEAEERAKAAEQATAALEDNMTKLQNDLANATAALEAAAKAPVAEEPSPDVLAMQEMIRTLTSQLEVTQTQAEASRASAEALRAEQEAAQQEADLAQQAAAIEGGFLSQYKWPLLIGGVAAVAAGLWYYFKKYKPAHAAPAAGGLSPNPEDEEEVFYNGELVGYVGPSVIEGRWVARSLLLDRPTYSALKKPRAVSWLKDLAAQG